MDQSIKNYLEHCKYERKLDIKTIKAYSLDLYHFEKFITINSNFKGIKSLNKNVIKNYLKHIHHYSPNTIKRKIASLKAFFNYHEFEDNISVSPFRKIRLKIKSPRRVPITLNLKELTAILNYAYSRFDSKGQTVYQELIIFRNIAILELMLSTGMRVSEVCNVRLSDFFENYKVIRVIGKGNKERLIPITNKNVVNALKSYKKLAGKNEFFFVNRLGNKIAPQSIRSFVKKYSIKAKISKKVSPHVFRHSFATILLEKEIDIRYIQQLLGHSSITTTQIYTTVSEKKKYQIMLKKNPRNFILLKF